MSEKKYELVEPTKELVEQYYDFWTKGYKNIPDEKWKVKMFKDSELEDVRNYISGITFDEYKKNDDEIMDYLKENNILDFFKKINAVYRTRFDVTKLAIEIKNRDWFFEKNVDELVKLSKEKAEGYRYSFATKVYSFVDQFNNVKGDKQNPIIDTLASSLLWYYMEDQYKSEHRKGKWGDYETYKDVYKEFAEKYGLNNECYKKIDVFLWTYANVILKHGIDDIDIKFSSVMYKPKK